MTPEYHGKSASYREQYQIHKKTAIRFQALGTDIEAFEIPETAADNLQVLKSI